MVNILPFRVYQLLSMYTDGRHALAMGELLRLLRTEYGLRCDRRAVYAALDKLRAAGCHIPEYQDDGEGYRLLSRTLEPSEVRLLSDAASAYPGISQRQCERLLKKLVHGLSRWQREQCRPLVVGTPWRGTNQEAFLSVEVLEEAISRCCQVQFQYMEYGMDKRLHPRRERPYQVSPYGLCFANGNYYLLCRYQGAENISHYRVDRIQSLVLLEDQVSEPLPLGLDLACYVRERVYPFPGEAIRAVLRCEADILSDVLDRFGTETQLRDNGDGTFNAVVLTGAAGLKFWALQYVAVCQVLEPYWLRREIGEILFEGWSRYQNSGQPERKNDSLTKKEGFTMKEDGMLLRIFPALSGRDLPVEELDLEVCTRNALERGGIHTLPQLLELTHVELVAAFPNRKLRCYEDVIHRLVCLSEEPQRIDVLSKCEPAADGNDDVRCSLK